MVAAPGGSGTACTDAAPCAITTAITQAGSGGEVLAKPGTYTMGSGTVLLNNVNLHGTPGPSRPRFEFPNVADANFRMTTGGSLADLDVVGGGSRAVQVEGSQDVRLERVALRCSVCIGATLNLQTTGGTVSVRDSLLATTAAGSAAITLFRGNASVSGVTALNTSTGPGVALSPSTGAGVQMTVRNSILDGGSNDLAANPAGSGGSAIVNISNTRYVTTSTSNTSTGPAGQINDEGGNTTVTPQFIGAPDFHPLATSPTLNLGGSAAFADPAAPGVDLDGVPRWFGSKPDLGAYEVAVAPTVDTPFATDVTSAGATFVATGVSPNVVAASTLRFDYGPSPAYSQTATVGLPSGGITPTTQTAAVSGLAPSTTYHVRAVLISPGGTATSDDRTFTTAAAPPVIPGPGPAPNPNPTPTPPDKTAPKLESVKPGASSVKRGKSTAATFKLTEAGKVTIRVQAILAGRLKGKTCVAPTKKLRKAKACTRYVTKLTVNANGTAGSNKVSLNTSKLARGKYRILVRATDAAGNVSRESATTFKIS